jgi:hypothetical protein
MFTLFAVLIVIAVLIIGYVLWTSFAKTNTDEKYAGYEYRFPYLHYPWYRRLGYYGRVYGLPFYLGGPSGRLRRNYTYPYSLM